MTRQEPPPRRTAISRRRCSMARTHASMREGPLAERFRATEAAQRQQTERQENEGQPEPASAPEPEPQPEPEPEVELPPAAVVPPPAPAPVAPVVEEKYVPPAPPVYEPEPVA